VAAPLPLSAVAWGGEYEEKGKTPG